MTLFVVVVSTTLWTTSWGTLTIGYVMWETIGCVVGTT